MYHGHAYPDYSLQGQKYVNSIIINSERLVSIAEERHTIAHELGHALINAPHWGGEPPAALTEQQRRNIMADGAEGYRF